MSANSHPVPNSLPQPVSRREFLYYLGGASLALFVAGAGAVVYKFAQPRNDLHHNPDILEFDPDQLSPMLPFWFREAQAFIIAANGQLTALDIHCTFPHQRWRVVWVGINSRFECPVCGSKYGLDGSWMAGLAPRGLDRLIVYAETPRGIIHTPEDGSPISIDGATQLWVDARTKIPGQPRE